MKKIVLFGAWWFSSLFAYGNAGCHVEHFDKLSTGPVETPTTTGTSPGCGMGFALDLPDEDPLRLLKKIVTDQVHFTTNVAETKFIDKHLMYDLLMEDTTIIDTSVILRHFVNNCRNNCIGQLYSVKKAIGNGNFNNAQSIVNSLDLLHPTEKNYQTYYNIFIKLQTDTLPLNPTDSTALIKLCNGCPFTDGAVVYSARALYNSHYHTYIPFSDNCPEQNGGGNLRKGRQEVETSNIFDVTLYPNPNKDGQVQVSAVGCNCKNVTITVTDVTGKRIYSGTLQPQNGNTSFTLNANNGLYIVRITDSETQQSTIKKIIITQ